MERVDQYRTRRLLSARVLRHALSGCERSQRFLLCLSACTLFQQLSTGPVFNVSNTGIAMGFALR